MFIRQIDRQHKTETEAEGIKHQIKKRIIPHIK